jgi:small subunit ribosomal protein S6
MAPLYDLTLLLDAAAPSERRDQILSEVEARIGAEGEIVGRHDWGVRNLAYEIEHRPEADYHLLQFKGPPSLLEELNRSLRIADGVVRFRIIKLRPGTPPPPELRSEPREAREPRGEPAEAAPAAAGAGGRSSAERGE